MWFFYLFHPYLTLTLFTDGYIFNKPISKCDNVVVLYQVMNTNCKTVTEWRKIVSTKKKKQMKFLTNETNFLLNFV